MTTYDALILAETGLKLYLKLQETSGTTATDASGNGYNGTYTASGITYSNVGAIIGENDLAIGFNGTTGRIDFTSGYNPTGSAISVETWYLYAASGDLSGFPRMVGNSYSDTTFKGFQLLLDPTAGEVFSVGNGTVNASASGTSVPVINVWHHVVGTWDGTTIKIYLDNSLVNSTSLSGSVQTSPNQISVGRLIDFDSNYFKGQQDRLAIYNVALTAAQVDKHYKQGRSALFTVQGNGTLTSTGKLSYLGASVLAGQGTLVTTTTVKDAGASTLAGTGTLTATGKLSYLGASTLAGTGTLTATGISTATLPSATLLGTGTLTAAGVSSFYGASTLAGSGTVTATGVSSFYGASVLGGSGTFVASGILSYLGASTLASTGTLTATPNVQYAGLATFSGQGTMTALGVSSFYGASVLSGSGALGAVPSYVGTTMGSAGFGGSGSLAIVGSVSYPVAQTIIIKQQVVKVYTSAGVFIDVWRDCPFLGYAGAQAPKFAVNNVTSQITLTLPRRFDNYDEGGDTRGRGTVTAGNIVQIWVVDNNTLINGKLVYQGYIDSYTPKIDVSGNESIDVTLTPFDAVLGDVKFIGSQNFGTVATPASYIDPVTMFNWPFSNTNAVTGNPYPYPLTLDGTNATTSGTTYQAQFHNQSLVDWFEFVRTLAPTNWYWRTNLDTKTVTFALAPVTAKHTFIIGKHISQPQYSKNFINLKNYIYLKATGVTSTATGADLTVYGQRSLVIVEPRIIDQTTANRFTAATLAQVDKVDYRSVLTIIDSRGDISGMGYDVETMKIGDTCKIINPTANQGPSLWDTARWDVSPWDYPPTAQINQVVIISALTYKFDSVDIELSTLQPSQDRFLIELADQLTTYSSY